MAKKVRINIDKLLEKHDLTQERLSDKSNVRQAAISQLARGFVSRISIEHIERIATALDIDDINEIITIIDEDKPKG